MSVRTLTVMLLTVWFGAVFVFGSAGLMVRPPGTPPFPILVGAVGPVLLFLGGYWGWPAFRAYVLSLDLSLGASIQAWRAGGLGFLALWAHGVLPGAFAWPAGVGDIAIGMTAPWVARALWRREDFARSRAFQVWNLMGVADLVVAVAVGGVISALATGGPGEVSTQPMARLPLVLIPAYLVPMFTILHLAALFQGRRTCVDVVPATGAIGGQL